MCFLYMGKNYFDLRELMVKVAEQELKKGAKEIGGNNRGTFVEKYLQGTGLKAPQPWCAAFVSWCLYEAGRRLRVKPKLPYTAGSRVLLNAAKRLKLVVPEPERGALVFWTRGNPEGPFGHVGIVCNREADKIVTIEGNKGGRVCTLEYELGKMPCLLGFARVA